MHTRKRVYTKASEGFISVCKQNVEYIANKAVCVGMYVPK